MKKLHIRGNAILKIAISLIVICFSVLVFIFQGNIESWFVSENLAAIENCGFEIYFIDVGQGDSTFMRFSDGKTALVDCGIASQGNDVANFISQLNVYVIDYLIYTHPDADHVGGGATIFDAFEVRNLYRPKCLAEKEAEKFGNPNGYYLYGTDAYNNAIMKAYDEGCNMYYNFAGLTISGDDYNMSFLYPTSNSYGSPNSPINNDYSAVIRVEAGGKSFLLTGDAENNVEEELIRLYNNTLDVDVLKVAHHASDTATSSKFLTYVKPEYAVISVGKNQWGFPHDEVINNLKAANAEIYTTKQNGTIAMGADSGVLIIGVYTESFKLDMPLFVCIMALILILVWGFPVITKKKVKTKKKTKRTNN